MKLKKFLVLSIVLTISLSAIVSANQIKLNEKHAEETEHYDYVIVTRRSLINAVKELKEWREQQGLSVKIVTGYHSPDELRNFLIEKYQAWGIKYVLIVGSHRAIPMKYCWPNPDDHSLFKPMKTNGQPIPTDHYYADLTSDWDRDNDKFYGEYKDDICNLTDFLPEIYVGRIPFDSPFEVKRFCNKIVKYEQDNRDWKKKALLLAPFVYYPDGDAAGGAEILKNSFLIPNGYKCTTMYEKDGIKPSNYSCDYPITHKNVIKVWREGYGIVNFISHGTPLRVRRSVWVKDDGDGIPEKNELKGDKFRPFQVNYFTFLDTIFLNDNKPSIVFSRSCFTSCPEIKRNLGASLLNRGAIIFIGAARPTFGGHIMNCCNSNEYFIKNITSKNIRMGDVWYNAKFYNIINNSMSHNKEEELQIWKDIFFVYNFGFYGDPATKMYSNICNLEEIK